MHEPKLSAWRLLQTLYMRTTKLETHEVAKAGIAREGSNDCCQKANETLRNDALCFVQTAKVLSWICHFLRPPHSIGRGPGLTALPALHHIIFHRVALARSLSQLGTVCPMADQESQTQASRDQGRQLQEQINTIFGEMLFSESVNRVHFT